MNKYQQMRRWGLGAVMLAGASAVSLPAHAVIEYDQDVTPNTIFGGGNLNGSYTTDRQNNVELGLRGKLRHDATGQPQNIFNSNGDGTYFFSPGVAPTQSSPTAEWSFEWSINTDLADTSGSPSRMLNAFSYVLGLDVDPSQGQNFTTFDPINDIEPVAGTVCWDHSMGTNTTGTDLGIETSGCRSSDPVVAAAAAVQYGTNLATYSVAQNSWKPHWYFSPFDPTVDGTYSIYLAAFDGGTEVARTSIDIIVGAGGLPVPEPATIGLFGFGLAGLALARRRRGKKA